MSQEDHRDFVITVLADSEAELLETLGVVGAQRDSYRLVAIGAIEQLRLLTLENWRLKARLVRMLDEMRAARTAA